MSFLRICTKCCNLAQRSTSVSFSLIRSQQTILNTMPLITQRLYSSAEAIPHPTPDGIDKVYPEKIKNIVEQIAKLTLIEVVDLNECLKKTLNIKDVPMTMSAMPAATPSTAAEEEEIEPVITKTSFTVKLLQFDNAKKVAVIKELKNHIEGMNLVQAKKFVESAPQVVKANISKDEADNLKKALETVGATCEIS